MDIISKTKVKILKGIEGGHCHGYGISKELGISLSTIYVHLAELVEAGFVEYEEKDRKKVYRLTEKGEMLLKALK